MKKKEIVRSSIEFNQIIKTGIKKQNDFYIIYNKENKNNSPRFGIAVGTKIGKAYLRNKLKRQVRTIIDKNKLLFSNNKDYIIIVKKEILKLNFFEMQNKLIELIKKKEIL